LLKASDEHAPSRGHELMTAVAKCIASPNAVAAAVAREFGLTKREGQVLRHAAGGKSIKEIAFSVGVTARDIEYFWRRIFAKLRCESQLRVMSLLLRRACGRNGG
jgi:DNA-binding CsgD family transcriptional regulator